MPGHTRHVSGKHPGPTPRLTRMTLDGAHRIRERRRRLLAWRVIRAGGAAVDGGVSQANLTDSAPSRKGWVRPVRRSTGRPGIRD